jgi:hypothetical protein
MLAVVHVALDADVVKAVAFTVVFTVVAGFAVVALTVHEQGVDVP